MSQGFKLTLATSDLAAYLHYGQTNFWTTPDTLRISARVRVVSESHLENGPRRGVSIGFTVGRDSANILFFARDTVFLWEGAYAQQGPTAFVDTDDAFRAYEIRVVNRSAITVYQDGVQILIGSALVDSGLADAPFLYWGDGTSGRRPGAVMAAGLAVALLRR